MSGPLTRAAVEPPAKRGWLRAWYDALMRLAGGRRAVPVMAAVSFAESSFFPIPPDVMLAPMILARPQRAYLYALVCTVASVLGGVLGYAIGFYLEPLGHQILALMGKADAFEQSRELFRQHGAWVILIKGLTPIPYKLITIASGVFSFNFPLFVLLSAITRGGRFFLTAFLLKRFGPAVLAVVERRLALVAVLGVVAAVAAVLLVKVL